MPGWFPSSDVVASLIDFSVCSCGCVCARRCSGRADLHGMISLYYKSWTIPRTDRLPPAALVADIDVTLWPTEAPLLTPKPACICSDFRICLSFHTHRKRTPPCTMRVISTDTQEPREDSLHSPLSCLSFEEPMVCGPFRNNLG